MIHNPRPNVTQLSLTRSTLPDASDLSPPFARNRAREVRGGEVTLRSTNFPQRLLTGWQDEQRASSPQPSPPEEERDNVPSRIGHTGREQLPQARRVIPISTRSVNSIYTTPKTLRPSLTNIIAAGVFAPTARRKSARVFAPTARRRSARVFAPTARRKSARGKRAEGDRRPGTCGKISSRPARTQPERSMRSFLTKLMCWFDSSLLPPLLRSGAALSVDFPGAVPPSLRAFGAKAPQSAGLVQTPFTHQPLSQQPETEASRGSPVSGRTNAGCFVFQLSAFCFQLSAFLPPHAPLDCRG